MNLFAKNLNRMKQIYKIGKALGKIFLFAPTSVKTLLTCSQIYVHFVYKLFLILYWYIQYKTYKIKIVKRYHKKSKYKLPYGRKIIIFLWIFLEYTFPTLTWEK